MDRWTKTARLELLDYEEQPHHGLCGLWRGSRPSALRAQFWLLCAAVLLLIIIYAAVFLDTLSRSPKYRSPGHRGEWDRSELHFDLHIEDRGVKYDDVSDNEEFLSHETHLVGSRLNSVAIGCAITTRMYTDLTVENMQFRLPLLRTLLPSFCNTLSSGYDYHFYVSFDANDPHLDQTKFLSGIFNHFEKIKHSLCTKDSNVSLHFVQCIHSHNPAWAQNDAMMEAYMDNVEYFYRVNDDTLMLSPGWTEIYIEALRGFDPPFVGVVGPVHRGGNEYILTYDFVHKTHINMFGYYYPRLFTDWWADDWITAVYGKERTVKLPSIKLKHTQEAGQRYKVQFDNGELVHYQVAHDRKTLNRYIYYRTTRSEVITADPRRLISMSLWGKDTKYTFGAIRNAQLVPVFFPGWQLRVYVEGVSGIHSSKYPLPPKRVLNKLINLGAEIIYVDTDEINIAPMLWRFLVLDDDSVDYFIVRDSDGRLNDRDSLAVTDWLEHSNSPFHCIRDHPSHSAYAISGGLWGGRPKQLQKLLQMPWKNIMSITGYRSGYGVDMEFLEKMMWSRVKEIAYCHDSYSCKRWPGSHPFPVKRRWTEHVGQVFDAFGYARDEDMKIIREAEVVTECISANATYFEPGADPKVNVAEAIDTRAVIRLEQAIEKRNQHQNMADALRHSSEEGNSQLMHKDVGIKKNDTSYKLDILNEKSSTKPETAGIFTVSCVWSMDFHVRPMQDIEYLLRARRHIVFVEKKMPPMCNSTHSCAHDLEVTTSSNHGNGMHSSVDKKRRFYEIYPNNTEMKTVTHFLCMFPGTICQLYMAFHKPIILYITTWYKQGRYTMKEWPEWDNNLLLIATDPNNHVIANNLYDAKYIQYYTGLHPTVIQPMCSYVNTSYNATKPNILLAAVSNLSFHKLFHGYLQKLIRLGAQTIPVDYIPEVYPSYSFHELSSYTAVIHIPYQVSTSYAFCEHYRMNIPIFVPSLDLLAQWHKKYKVISDLSWNLQRARQMVNGTLLSVSSNMTDPDHLRTIEDFTSWLAYTEFYQRPHLLYFNSVKHLVTSLLTTNFTTVSKNMAYFNSYRETLEEEQWSSIFQ